MRVAILFNEPGADPQASDQDVLVQRDAVARALAACGHTSVAIGCTLNLAQLQHQLAAASFDCAFNLVESLGGTDQLQPLVPLLLDALNVPYTGSPASTMLATADKVAVKCKLRALGLPTPDWICANDPSAQIAPGKFIVKARFEHASVGMDDSSVMAIEDANELKRAICKRSAAYGHKMFAERFVDGREFNIALLAVDDRPQVLSPAEIDFSAFPATKPKIVGYDAKWTESSFEFGATPRRFDFLDSDEGLLDKLSMLARSVWSEFNLKGYARVDFRVDNSGNPLILELNTNPCLSPDAGYAAALTASGYSFEAATDDILQDAVRSTRQ